MGRLASRCSLPQPYFAYERHGKRCTNIIALSVVGLLSACTVTEGYAREYLCPSTSTHTVPSRLRSNRCKASSLRTSNSKWSSSPAMTVTSKNFGLPSSWTGNVSPTPAWAMTVKTPGSSPGNRWSAVQFAPSAEDESPGAETNRCRNGSCCPFSCEAQPVSRIVSAHVQRTVSFGKLSVFFIMDLTAGNVIRSRMAPSAIRQSPQAKGGIGCAQRLGSGSASRASRSQ